MKSYFYLLSARPDQGLDSSGWQRQVRAELFREFNLNYTFEECVDVSQCFGLKRVRLSDISTCHVEQQYLITGNKLGKCLGPA